jgi:hypothetical protein
LSPQLPRAITTRREAARRKAEAFDAAQRELAELRARLDAQATELRERGDELDRQQERVRSLEALVESLQSEIRAAARAQNGTDEGDQVASLLATAGPGERTTPARDDIGRHLAGKDDRALAEVFDTALRSWAIRERLGAYDEADDWRRLALATVAEASTRPSFNGTANGSSRSLRDRLRMSSGDRLMRRLSEACQTRRT